MNLLHSELKSTDKITQTKRILKVLKTKGRVTNVELVTMRILRGSERIRELKGDGYRIVSHHVMGGVWEYVYKGHEDDDEPRVKEFDCGN